MYQSWLQDQEEEYTKLKDFSTYIGSFSNYEMAKQVYNDKNKYNLSDDEFEESYQKVVDYDKITENVEKSQKHRRARRKILKQDK